MRALRYVLLSALTWSAVCWAQETPSDTGPSEAERHTAAMALLLLVVGGLGLTFLLLWFLRRIGKLPEEKPMPRPRWVHPEDDVHPENDDSA